MANAAPNTKRALIDKANTRIVVYVSVAAFILVFSLVSTKTLIGQAAYQNRIISKKRVAVTNSRLTSVPPPSSSQRTTPSSVQHRTVSAVTLMGVDRRTAITLRSYWMLCRATTISRV